MGRLGNLAAAYRRASLDGQGDCYLATVASRRYLQHGREEGVRRNPDHLVRHLLTEEELAHAETEELEALRAFPFYHYLLARTRFYDAVVLDALGDGVTQIVVFGAGLDTRAYRFSEELRRAGARVVETDLAEPIARKRERVDALGEHAHVTYHALDLAAPGLDAWPASTGLSPDEPTLLYAEGVSLYLSAEAVRGWLTACRWFRRSTFAYDLGVASRADRMVRLVRKRSSFRLSPESSAVRRFHGRCGWRVRERLPAPELMRARLDYDFGRPWESDMAVVLVPDEHVNGR